MIGIEKQRKKTYDFDRNTNVKQRITKYRKKHRNNCLIELKKRRNQMRDSIGGNFSRS